MPPSSTATLRSSYPAAISRRAARALVRSSTHAQYRMIVRSGGNRPAGACPWAASMVASGSDSAPAACVRSEEHTSELQSRLHLVCRLLLEKKKTSKVHHRGVSTALGTTA